MEDEIVDVVDNGNNVIGQEKRGVVHLKGMLHRSVHVIVFNSRGWVLLQKRSPAKIVCPLKWDLSTAETLKAGETYKEAAERGLKEELGIIAEIEKIRDARLQKHEYLNRKIKDYEFVELYKAVYDTIPKIDKTEVSEARFFPVEEIRNMINTKRSVFTPWFIEEWKYIEKAGMLKEHLNFKI